MKDMIDISTFVSVLTEQKVISDLILRFKKRRKEAGLTQKELASRSGVSYGSIRRFELSGDISFASLLKLASVVGCLSDFNELFKYQIVKELRRPKL